MKNTKIPVETEKQVRCLKCKKLLFKGPMPQDAIEIQCPRCKEKTIYKRIT